MVVGVCCVLEVMYLEMHRAGDRYDLQLSF